MRPQHNLELSGFSFYFQQALRPFSKKNYYSNYVNSLPIKASDKMLEFGSGIGAMAELFVKNLSEGQLTCIDVSNKYLSVARKNLKDYPNTTFVKGRHRNLKIEEKGFDAINIHFVLHDIPELNRSKMINEMFDLLRPGGKVFLREPIKSTNGIPIGEIKVLFRDAGFYTLYEEEEKNLVMGEVYTACFTKISTIRFFLT